ncbi:MAG TPA: hypothetical protein VH682_31330 [Gemmataceae bacterium]|jgi:hypothetical protein
MATEWMVDVDMICDRSLQLFTNENNAWDHMRVHGLGMRNGRNGEEQGWGLLLPALQSELTAGQLPDLRDVARATNFDPDHARLGPIYMQFLDSIQHGVERASRLNWFWEDAPGSDHRWSTFGREGIFAHLDEDYVRTGYLPEHDTSKWSGGTGNACFRLFQSCLRRVQFKHDRAVKSRRIEKVQPALEKVLRSGLTEAEWTALT